MTMQIKQCPFCGGQARTRHGTIKVVACKGGEELEEGLQEIHTDWRIECQECGFTSAVRNARYTLGEDGVLAPAYASELKMGKGFDGRQELVEAWNKRCGDCGVEDQEEEDGNA